ncbi:LCP family glycopolymer transferase [Streptomyces hundungensis]|uniref:LCP family protein n=1 Tax=Streptomyces hundungensis TaxID=1077946 RepID=UPI003F56FF6F
MTDSAGTHPDPEDRAGTEQPPPAPGTETEAAAKKSAPGGTDPEPENKAAAASEPAPGGTDRATDAAAKATTPSGTAETDTEPAASEPTPGGTDPKPDAKAAASEAAPSGTDPEPKNKAAAASKPAPGGTDPATEAAAKATTPSGTAAPDTEPAASKPTPRGTDPEPDTEPAASEPAPGGTDPATDAAAKASTPSGTDPAPHAKRRRHWLRYTALGVSVVVLAAAGTGWWFYRKLDGNIHTDTSAASELDKYERDRPVSVVHDAENLLLIGSDSRAGSNSSYGRDDGGSQRSDTTILLHLAADRLSATAVSLPRDLMADLPACGRPDGTTSRAQFAQFNSAFEIGGAACTIRTVEKMTGVRIDHHMVVDFSGFKDMVDAVDGVEVCLKEPVEDRQAHLELPAGRQTLHGEQALGFVRSRHGFGDGSDTQRMDRQQQFLGSLVKKVQSNGVLLNPTRLYPVLDAATKSLTTDPGLNTLKDLYDLVSSMRDIPTQNIRFLTVPRQPYVYNGDRDELVQPDADRLFQQLRDDQPIKVAPAGDVAKLKEDGGKDRDGKGGDGKDRDGDGKPDDPGPTPSPSAPPVYSGTDATSGMCG